MTTGTERSSGARRPAAPNRPWKVSDVVFWAGLAGIVGAGLVAHETGVISKRAAGQDGVTHALPIEFHGDKLRDLLPGGSNTSQPPTREIVQPFNPNKPQASQAQLEAVVRYITSGSDPLCPNNNAEENGFSYYLFGKKSDPRVCLDAKSARVAAIPETGHQGLTIAIEPETPEKGKTALDMRAIFSQNVDECKKIRKLMFDFAQFTIARQDEIPKDQPVEVYIDTGHPECNGIVGKNRGGMIVN